MNTSEEYEERQLIHTEQFTIHQTADFREDKEFFFVSYFALQKSFNIFGFLGLAYWTAGFYGLVPWETRPLYNIFVLIGCLACGVFCAHMARQALKSQSKMRSRLYSYHDEKFVDVNDRAKTEFMAYKECLGKFPETNMDKHERKFTGFVVAILGVIVLSFSGFPISANIQALILLGLGIFASYQWLKFKKLRNDFDESRDTILDQAVYHLLEAKIHSHS